MSKVQIAAKIRNAMRSAERLARVVEALPSEADTMTLREFRVLREASDNFVEHAETLHDDIYHIGNPRVPPSKPIPE